MRIVVIGGAGGVGSLIVPTLAQQHDVMVADRRPASWWGGDFVLTDVLDHRSLPALFQGVDALVYMAMGPEEGWGSTGWARQHFDVNVTGLHLALQAAGHAGVHRIVHTSSGSVFADWNHRAPHDLPDAVDAYGLSKACGEKVAEAASRQFAIPVVALRLFLPKPLEEYRSMTGPEAGIATAASDVAAAYLAALTTDVAPGFHTPHISGNRGGTISLEYAKDLLGWEPLVC
ncbi:NAD-dependent epimerase/dehydratase family protein [Tessaracoccus sp.]